MSEVKSESAALAGPSTSGGQQQREQLVATTNAATAGQNKSAELAARKPRQRFAPEKKKEDPPLILEQATVEAVPQHLEKLMAQYEENRKIPSAELLDLLIYLLALESGFVEEETYGEKRHLLKPVPAFSSFHALNVRLLSEQPVRYTNGFTINRMRLRTLLDKHAPEEASLVATLQSRLMTVNMGDDLMVTLSPAPQSNQPGYSICLSIGRYVLNVQAKKKPIYHRFRKLDELSYQLKQNIFQPMRSQQLMQMEQKLQPSLLGLPDELYDEIFRHLNPSQLKVVSRVNRQLQFYSKQAEKKRAKS